MDAASLTTHLADRVLVLSGATGTELQKRGLPPGACPETWVLEHPDSLKDVQQSCFRAGSDAVFTCTFGANRQKLADHGVDPERVTELNEKLAGLTRQICPPAGLVGGDVGPLGELVEPFGALPFEEAIRSFREQIHGLVRGVVDFIIIETMMDIQEARAALLAAKAECDLPILVSMTYEQEGTTLTGTSPDVAAVILESLGAFAVGCNCSTGPAQMGAILARMRAVARVPIFAKPNAGLPTIAHGCTVFPMGPDEFARETARLVDEGAALVGGCCGTTPEHIAALSHAIGEKRPPELAATVCPAQLRLASPRRLHTPKMSGPITVIGERINPTGKPRMQRALRDGRLSIVRRLAQEQADAGAQLLDVNVGAAKIAEADVLPEVVKLLGVTNDCPLCVDSSSPEAIEKALRIYPGRALLNSISAEPEKLDRILPIAAQYGAAVIVLPVAETSLPMTSAERREVVLRIFERAEAAGLGKEDIVVDGLTLALSSNAAAAVEALDTIAWAHDTFGTHTVLGLSNISFGLPARAELNATFLSLARERGLTMVIADPAVVGVAPTTRATEALLGEDAHCRRYIDAHRDRQADADQEPAGDITETGSESPAAEAFQAVLNGDRDAIKSVVSLALDAGVSPLELMEHHLVPALFEVGERFQRREYFLPQLMLSAETMERAFDHLKPLLEARAAASAGRVVLATVKGDIHDIGKNIVALMLRNHGFTVHDLGKDVSSQEIVSATMLREADLVMLSALMTTTMTQMPQVIRELQTSGLLAKVIVGGAVVTEDYAREIGADGYAADAVGAVKIANKVLAAKRGDHAQTDD